MLGLHHWQTGGMMVPVPGQVLGSHPTSARQFDILMVTSWRPLWEVYIRDRTIFALRAA